MSISGTLSSALSGLNATTRAADVVSNNIANALTDGFARRELQQTARSVGGSGQGVQVTGISRVVDQVLISDRRTAEADSGDRDVRAAFLARLEQILGTPESAESLGAKIAGFDAALIEAASRPDSDARLSNVLSSADMLVHHLGAASDEIQVARAAADDRIFLEVTKLNDTLVRVAEINDQIGSHAGAGRDASALMDQRQQLIDTIATILPLREVGRGNGQIALYTTGGAVLLDGRPATFGFTPVGVITPDMTLASGALSGLTLNDRPLRTAGDSGPIAGGTLAAHFAVRDQLAPAQQARLDAVARDLVERFADPALDGTRAVGDPGLFTDAGAAFLVTNELGLSQRLTVNAAADPARGGALWRLRDGLGAVAPGPSGDASLLITLQSALTAPRTTASGGFLPHDRSLSGLAAEMLSGVSTARLSAETAASFAGAKSDALRMMELEAGVDTDHEMQRLLLIERAFAANAKVVQTVDEMIQMLLGL